MTPAFTLMSRQPPKPTRRRPSPQCLDEGPSIWRRLCGFPKAWFRCGSSEPIYGLPISLRMVGSHPLDRSQCKREKCVAAALQGRSYRLRTDEFAESQHSRGIGKLMRRGQILVEEVLRHFNGVDNYALGAHRDKNSQITVAFQSW